MNENNELITIKLLKSILDELKKSNELNEKILKKMDTIGPKFVE